MSDDYAQKNGIVYKNHYHVLFCTKFKRSVLKDGVDDRLKELLYKATDRNEIKIVKLRISSDYVRMIISTGPDVSPHKSIKKLMNYSAGVLREEFPWLKSKLPSIWSKKYLCNTIGEIDEDVVTAFMNDQKWTNKKP